MDEYKPNSNRSKEKAKQEKLISGAAKVKKKSGVKKFTNAFISDDAGKVKSYILMDVIIPMVKKTIMDVVTNGLDIALNGESSRSKKNSAASRVSYGKFFDDRSNNRVSEISRVRNGYDYNDIVLESRMEAEEVLERMDELIATYGIVSVADFYDLCGVTSNYTDNKYGWTDIRSANVTRVRDGYLIKLPRALPIN